MDLETHNWYAGVPLALYRSLIRGLLGCCISCVDCMLSARCVLTEEGAEPFVQAGDSACHVKMGQLL